MALLVTLYAKLLYRDRVKRVLPAGVVASLLCRDRVQHKGKVSFLLPEETVVVFMSVSTVVPRSRASLGPWVPSGDQRTSSS